MFICGLIALICYVVSLLGEVIVYVEEEKGRFDSPAIGIALIVGVVSSVGTIAGLIGFAIALLVHLAK